MITQAVIALLFGIVGIAVIGWVASIIPEVRIFLKDHVTLLGIFQTVFNAAPVQQEANKTSEPVKIVLKDILPILFWLLILLPMFVFPIILIIFPIMHIPWSYLLPPTG